MTADTVFLIAAYVFIVCGVLGLAASLAQLVRPEWADRVFRLKEKR